MKEEKRLVEEAKNNTEAFGELYEFYYPKIFGYIYRILGDYHLACDITSETFVKAFLKIGSFRWKDVSISSWFFRIATNELNQYFRKKKYSPVTLIDLFVHTELCKDPHYDDPTSEIRIEDDFKKLSKQLKTLPPLYQQVIALKYFEELSIKEISEILNKKEGTVKSLLSRGLEKLRKLM